MKARRSASEVVRIAAEADVAIATVNSFIKGRPIRPASRRRIEHAIAVLKEKEKPARVVSETYDEELLKLMKRMFVLAEKACKQR